MKKVRIKKQTEKADRSENGKNESGNEIKKSQALARANNIPLWSSLPEAGDELPN